MQMVRNASEVWSNSEPPGTFDIEDHPHGVEGQPGVTAHILFVCPNGKRCSVFVGPAPVERPRPDACYTWGWNGDKDRPTLTPSINCIAEKDGKPTGGCGWHGFIANGEMT